MATVILRWQNPISRMATVILRCWSRSNPISTELTCASRVEKHFATGTEQTCTSRVQTLRHTIFHGKRNPILTAATHNIFGQALSSVTVPVSLPLCCPLQPHKQTPREKVSQASGFGNCLNFFKAFIGFFGAVCH